MNTQLPRVDAPKVWEYQYRAQILSYLADKKENVLPIELYDRREWDQSFHPDSHKILADLKESMSSNIGWLTINLNAQDKHTPSWTKYGGGMPDFLAHCEDDSIDFVPTRKAPVNPGLLAEILSREEKFEEFSEEILKEIVEKSNIGWAYFLINNLAEDWEWNDDNDGTTNFRFLNENGHFEKRGLSVKEIELVLFVLGPLKGKMTDCLRIVFGAYFYDDDRCGWCRWLNSWRFWVTQNQHIMKKLDPYLRKNVSKQFIAIIQPRISLQQKNGKWEGDVKEFVQKNMNA